MSQPEDLTPEEEQVRRLLADARHTEPLPQDVGDRLDSVLADLAHEDPAAPTPVPASRPPFDLAAARRRRNVRSWLVAAAAVVVLGVGIDQLAQVSLSGGDSDSSSSGAADSAQRESGRNQVQDGDASSDRAGKPTPSTASSPLSAVPQAPVRLDSARFGTEVARLQARSDLRAQAGTVTTDGRLFEGWDEDLDGAYAATCPAEGWGGGILVPVRYDGKAGALIFRKVQGDTQVVDLFLCGSDEPARSITLPAP